MDKIKCIYCGKEFEITEALREHIKSQEFSKIKKGYEEEKSKLKERVEKAEENELQVRKQKDLLEEEKRSFELEKQRQIDAERKKIRESAYKEADDIHQLREKEDKLTIDRLKKQIEEARRTASQGSQQTQGEVLELEIEDVLREVFPLDEIVPVEKGITGADVKQIVKSPSGKTICGMILWESKRTKSWTDSWIPKLKDDTRKVGADISALISQVLPDSIKEGMRQIDGVWVCNRQLFIPLAMLLREILTKVSFQKMTQAHQGKKSDLIYEYTTSNQFVQQFEAIVEAYREMKEQVNEERAAFEKRWRQREAQLQRILLAAANVYGTIQGLAGSSTMPPLKGLELPELESGE